MAAFASSWRRGESSGYSTPRTKLTESSVHAQPAASIPEYLRRTFGTAWVARRLRTEVAEVCRLTEHLQVSSLDPAIDGARSLGMARDVLVLLREELKDWHLSESRVTLTGVAVTALGSIDRAEVLARHQIRVPAPLSDDFEDVRRRLLQDLVTQVTRQDSGERGARGSGLDPLTCTSVAG